MVRQGGGAAPAPARSAPVRRPEKRAPRRTRTTDVSPLPISVPPAPVVAGGARAASRAPFVVLVLALAVLGLIGLVLLNTAVNENAFRLHDLDTRQDALNKQESQLQQDLDNREAPASLAAQAQKMGLVPAGDPAFVVLPDGKVVGTPEPAQAPSSPAPSSPVQSSPASSGSAATSPAGQPPAGQPTTTPSPSAR
jgi:hypothetical protein